MGLGIDSARSAFFDPDAGAVEVLVGERYEEESILGLFSDPAQSVQGDDFTNVASSLPSVELQGCDVRDLNIRVETRVVIDEIAYRVREPQRDAFWDTVKFMLREDEEG